jgi:hypothetical protein
LPIREPVGVLRLTHLPDWNQAKGRRYADRRRRIEVLVDRRELLVPDCNQIVATPSQPLLP